jgi:four helix bundle protein
MGRSIRTFRDLIVWQKSMDLAELAFELADALEKERLFVFSNQLQRSALSIPSNLAEGHGRFSRFDFARFVGIANGSLRELECQLELLGRRRMKYRETTYKLLLRADEIGRLLRAMHHALRRPPH